MQHIKGPDFPTGCDIHGTRGIREYIRTGHGSVRIRGKVEIEENGNREQIIITRDPVRREPRRAGEAHRRAREREDHSPASAACATSPTRTPAS